MQTDSPRPSDASDVDAQAISDRLTRAIREEIEAAGGWIRFSRFMDRALYAPGLGYYSAGAAKIGRDARDGSDFVTAPELSPLFARALARPVAEILAGGGDTVFELGGGTGALAADLLLELEALGRLPRHYALLDVSADLRARQRATLAQRVPHLVDRIAWPQALPDRIHGVVIANEVLDALPVELVVWDGAGWRVRGVTVCHERFAWVDRSLPEDLVAGLAPVDTSAFAAGYQTETHPMVSALVSTLLTRMTAESVALLIDYGFPRSEYFHPQRSSGTLMVHRHHRAASDPLVAVGLQDITAHVDFSAVAAAALAAGGCVVGYTSQASFLIDCGIAGLMTVQPTTVAPWAAQASALNLLLSEAEMGELFKVIGLARRPQILTGFRRQDRSESLGV
jgi:SAM-dependent MidA family methyltransferase